jgi:anti-anti-sigma factor
VCTAVRRPTSFEGPAEKLKIPSEGSIKEISMSVILEQGDGLCVIRLEGEIGISSAAELKVILLQALASGKKVRVDLKTTTEIDITALQLLLASEREARGSGCEFVLAGPILGEVSGAAHGAGFEKFPLQLDPR